MKRFFLAALAIAAIASCAKNEVTPSDPQEITYQAVVGKATKALVETTAYPTTETFGTVAYLNTDPAQVYIPASEVSYYTANKYWSTATAYYWPVNGNLTFYSYSPFNYSETPSTPIGVSHTATTLSFDNYNVGEHQATDLMVAEVQKNLTANNMQITGWVKGVNTIFHHKLSQVVKITFKTVDTQNPESLVDYANGHDGSSGHEYVAGDQQYVINSVKFKNLYFTGDYLYNAATTPVTESWTPEGSVTSETTWMSTPTNISSGELVTTKTGSENYLLVLPQTFTNTGSGDASICVNYSIKTYIDATNYSTETIETEIPLYNIHTGNKWDMNKKISYEIKMSKHRIYWAPSVEAWDDTVNPSATI